jgi:hypothetical protein
LEMPQILECEALGSQSHLQDLIITMEETPLSLKLLARFLDRLQLKNIRKVGGKGQAMSPLKRLYVNTWRYPTDYVPFDLSIVPLHTLSTLTHLGFRFESLPLTREMAHGGSWEVLQYAKNLLYLYVDFGQGISPYQGAAMSKIMSSCPRSIKAVIWVIYYHRRHSVEQLDMLDTWIDEEWYKTRESVSRAVLVSIDEMNLGESELISDSSIEHRVWNQTVRCSKRAPTNGIFYGDWGGPSRCSVNLEGGGSGETGSGLQLGDQTPIWEKVDLVLEERQRALIRK